MEVYTSRFGNRQLATLDATFVAISLGLPKWQTAYEIHERVRCLAPHPRMLDWPEEEYRPAYIDILDGVGVQLVSQLLSDIWERHGRKPLVLLCHENVAKPGQWCHRRIFAEWWEQQTGQRIEELQLTGADQGSQPTQMALW